ncbi:MAG: 50S ribosomal protein L33 [Candidatus Zambryskibacteria bacterium CG10_big_fil_rev_8_21_14_0_10_42_12]|uniref:Large ribosomal subunit protein bL33 n=1 Tax=Candidatus Zambryskibacteria bacterium CG10_big_fil_rev_8_21_14_0_10_42_12 TaxID=1975115 RepID=A0A2H0QTF9_9BACT|nr:MAG: 50S ribosomal protein L33 [Candidatus Zambryskibacteria bacterium CG10_big_fil_rev_8_21_14_0_10_42_12]
MAKSKRSDNLIGLKCSDCKRRNYYTTRNRKLTERKIELKKFCSWCRKSLVHKEGKITGK